jgi:hypothetical protein
VVTAAIIRSVSELKHVLGIIFLFFLILGILGMGMFKGTLKQRCFYATTPDSLPDIYQNLSIEQFSAEWTDAFGDLMSARSREILSPTLKRLKVPQNLSRKDFLGDPGLVSKIETQAYADNLWRLARPACDGPGLQSCDELYLPPLCTNPVDAKDRINAGGHQCQPDNNGFVTVCRASSPFFEVPNQNPPLFQGWYALTRREVGP